MFSPHAAPPDVLGERRMKTQRRSHPTNVGARTRQTPDEKIQDTSRTMTVRGTRKTFYRMKNSIKEKFSRRNSFRGRGRERLSRVRSQRKSNLTRYEFGQEELKVDTLRSPLHHITHLVFAQHTPQPRSRHDWRGGPRLPLLPPPLPPRRPRMI